MSATKSIHHLVAALIDESIVESEALSIAKEANVCVDLMDGAGRVAARMRAAAERAIRDASHCEFVADRIERIIQRAAQEAVEVPSP